MPHIFVGGESIGGLMEGHVFGTVVANAVGNVWRGHARSTENSGIIDRDVP